MSWEKVDSDVHAEMINTTLSRGFCPGADEIATTLKISVSEVRSSFKRLELNHALILHPNSDNPWIVHPFSLAPTSTWVETTNRGWWAPCLWCGFGVASLLADDDVTVHSKVAGESEPVQFEFKGGKLTNGHSYVHFTIAPKKAWDNVHHFCAHVLPFKSEDQISEWCLKYNFPRGGVTTTVELYKLATLWYGPYANHTWIKWDKAQAAEIFEKSGLTEKFWKLENGNNERF